MHKLSFWILLAFVFSSTVYSGSENGKFTAAFWGDSRGNDGNAFSEICGYLVREKGKTVDVHFQNGDFTQKGTTSDWNDSWRYDNVREACVKDYFFMCTSNHDNRPTEWQANMVDILPSNGKNAYYYHKSWPIPGSRRMVHLLSFDQWFTEPEEQITYFKDKLKDAKPDDWIIALWHAPSYNFMTYKDEEGGDKTDYINYIIPPQIGGDFVLNGHAHVYVRTKILDKDGKMLEDAGGPFTSHTSPDSSYGLVHLVNGRGGVFGIHDPPPIVEGHAFAPHQPREYTVGLLTLMEFDDNTVHLKTIEVGDDSYESKVLDSWTWTRGAPMSLSTDSIAPVVTVNVTHTSDQTPALTGTIDDPTATITIEVNGEQHVAINNGNGTWILADNTLSSLVPGMNYDVKVTAVDTAGNIGTDLSTNELVNAGGNGERFGMASLASSAFPVYVDNGSIRIEIPFDVSHKINIVGLHGKVLKTFSGNQRGEHYWANVSNANGVFYVIVDISGKKFFRKIILM
ncbi:MAG: metallophosphoesterase [Fibrobacteria bacterium]|nr:metallophosphoesterase [Fibrobacteria bacterium]